MFDIKAPVIVMGDGEFYQHVVVMGTTNDKRVGVMEIHKHNGGVRRKAPTAEAEEKDIGKRLVTIAFTDKEAIKKMAETLMKLYDVVEG